MSCATGAKCNDLGAASTVTCSDSAKCTVKCTTDCTVTCSSSATCTVGCGLDGTVAETKCTNGTLVCGKSC